MSVREQRKELTLMICAKCGTEFRPMRATKRFCSKSCRVGAFNQNRRQLTRMYRSEQRSAICLTFDGRLGGKPRDVGRISPRYSAPRVPNRVS